MEGNNRNLKRYLCVLTTGDRFILQKSRHLHKHYRTLSLCYHIAEQMHRETNVALRNRNFIHQFKQHGLKMGEKREIEKITKENEQNGRVMHAKENDLHL